MINIDFLPARFHEQNKHRKKQIWRVLVVMLFVGAVFSLVVYQRIYHQMVYDKLVQVRKQYEEAEGLNSKMASLQMSLASTRSEAELYAYLQHPWPKTRLLHVLMDNLPEAVTIEELKISTERKNSVRVTRRRQASTSKSAKDDLVKLRETFDGQKTVVTLTGVTYDVARLHIYVSRLSAADIFSTARLMSLTDDGEKPVFELRVEVKTGHGVEAG